MKLDLQTLTDAQYNWLVDILKQQYITQESKHNRDVKPHSIEIVHLSIDFDVHTKKYAK